VFASTAVQKIRDKVAAILSAAFREVFGAAEVDSAPVRSPTFLKESNNFCFLNPTRIENIKAALTQKLDYVIRDFGSISFVLENHEDLKKQSKEFRKEFPYPDIFFSAIRTLDRLGSPKARNSDLLLDTKSFAVDAALVIGYYLENARTEDVGITTCNSKAAFFLGLNEDSSADIARTIYCDRFDTAAKILESLKNGSAMRRSKRAANVLGINDGIHRWPVRVMSGSARGCNSGSEFVVFAKGSGADNKRTARNLVKRVGFEKNEIICEWDPARYKHNVPALFLKGSQDAAIHGCQAEYFFKEGVLTSDKHFVEFPELGHDWISEVKPERKGDLATLLAEFVDDPAHFKDSNNAQEAIARLGANFVTVASFAASGC